MEKLIHLTIVLGLFASTCAFKFYQPVDGKCSDLPTVEVYDDEKIATGEWYYQYASFGQEGDKCSTGHSVARNHKHYIDLFMFDAMRKHYIKFPNDLTYHPDQPGVYTDASGAEGHVVASDLLSYFYYVQCAEEETTKVVAVLATREPVVDKNTEQVYKDFSAVLEEIKLLPKMHKINQTDCPPKFLADVNINVDATLQTTVPDFGDRSEL